MLIFIGTLVPIVTNILGGLKIIQMNVYITPVTFVFTVFCLFLAVFKFNLLKSTPIALQRIVDRISDSYVVLNENYEISDFNQTYVNTFKVKNPVKDRGINFLHILEKYSINSKEFYNRTEKIKGTEETDSFQLYIEPLEKYFRVEITSIMINGQFIRLQLPKCCYKRIKFSDSLNRIIFDHIFHALILLPLVFKKQQIFL